MSVINVMAAAHRGQCFSLLGHRLQLAEDDVARGVVALARVLLPIIEQEVSNPAGMAAFLKRLAEGRFTAILDDPQAFADSDLKMRGRNLAHRYLNDGSIDRDGLELTLQESGLTSDQLARLLPHAIVLTMAAVQRRLQRPLREIVERSAGRTRKLVEGDRVALVADYIRDGEIERPKLPLGAGRLGSLLQRAMSGPSR